MESILKYQQLFIVFSCILVHSAHAFDVKGTIKFKGEKPATLSAGSWLVVKMQDVSKMDAPAETLSTFEEEIKDYPAKPLAYQMSYNNVNVNKDQTITVRNDLLWCRFKMYFHWHFTNIMISKIGGVVISNFIQILEAKSPQNFLQGIYDI